MTEPIASTDDLPIPFTRDVVNAVTILANDIMTDGDADVVTQVLCRLFSEYSRLLGWREGVMSVVRWGGVGDREMGGRP